MRDDAPLILAHAADSPVLLLGGPALMIAFFLFLERSARKRAREEDREQDDQK